MVKNGFTLVEAAITLAILAIAASVVIPSMNRITRAELRRVSGQLSGMMRTAYDSAALTGQVHRLRFDFEKHFFCKYRLISPEKYFFEIIFAI